jgi:hypothetical protein
MVNQRANLDYGRDDQFGDDDRVATDASIMSEGVGGGPDLDDDERAMVSDPDGDNVDDRRPINEEADTLGAP